MFRVTTVLFISFSLFAPPDIDASDAGPTSTGEAEADVLGELVVQASPDAPLVLPKLALEADPAGIGVDRVFLALVRRDMDLVGQFNVTRRDDPAPFAAPFDADKWRRRGVQYVLRSHAEVLDDGRVLLELRVFMPELGDLPAARFEEVVSARDLRRGGHRLVDRAIGSITGVDGPFESRLLVVVRERRERSLYVMDADGTGLRRVSPREHTVIAATFGPDGVPHWVGGPRGAPSRLYRAGRDAPLPVGVPGSLYGVAWHPVSGWALSVAQGERIQLFVGAQLTELKAATDVDFALSPAFSPEGKLLYSATRGRSTRVRTATAALSPGGQFATHPSVCDGPLGTWAVYQLGQGKQTQVARTPAHGGAFELLTSGSDSRGKPACSPDGRIVVYTASSAGRRQGLYMMRVDGRRARKLSSQVVEEIHWARLPR